MEEALKQALSEAIRQVPSLVVLAVVVWMFVKVIFRFITHIDDRGHVMQELHRDHMEERQSARKVMNDIAISLNTITMAVERLKKDNDHK